MKRTIVILCCLLGLSIVSPAQNHMRIHYKGGAVNDIPVEQIDSITFVQKDTPEEEASLIGEWFWGSVEQGYYELRSMMIIPIQVMTTISHTVSIR